MSVIVYKLELWQLACEAFIIKMEFPSWINFISFRRLERYGREVVEQLKKQGCRATLFSGENFTRDFFLKHKDVFGKGNQGDENGVKLKEGVTREMLLRQFHKFLPPVLQSVFQSTPCRDAMQILEFFPKEEGEWLRTLGFSVGVIEGTGMEFWQLSTPDGYMWVKRFKTMKYGGVYAVTIETNFGHHTWIQTSGDMKQIMLEAWGMFVNDPSCNQTENPQESERRYKRLKEHLFPIMDKVKEDYEKETV